MEELMTQMTMLKRAVDIIDASPDEINYVKIQLGEIATMIQNTQNLVEKYKIDLYQEAEKLEKDKMLIAKIKEFHQRLDYMLENMPQSTDTNGQQSTILSPINQSIFAQPQQIQEVKNHVKEVKNHAKEVKNHVKEVKNIEPLYRTLEKSYISTPEPRKDLGASVNYVTNAEFDEVPQYMKGRLKMNDVNGFIDIYNTVINKKEEVLLKNKNSLKNKKEMDLWIVWKGQAKGSLAGLYFCTAKDFDTLGGVKLGKREFSIIIILRHVKRIREVREKGSIYYAACF